MNNYIKYGIIGVLGTVIAGYGVIENFKTGRSKLKQYNTSLEIKERTTIEDLIAGNKTNKKIKETDVNLSVADQKFYEDLLYSTAEKGFNDGKIIIPLIMPNKQGYLSTIFIDDSSYYLTPLTYEGKAYKTSPPSEDEQKNLESQIQTAVNSFYDAISELPEIPNSLSLSQIAKGIKIESRNNYAKADKIKKRIDHLRIGGKKYESIDDIAYNFGIYSGIYETDRDIGVAKDTLNIRLGVAKDTLNIRFSPEVESNPEIEGLRKELSQDMHELSRMKTERTKDIIENIVKCFTIIAKEVVASKSGLPSDANFIALDIALDYVNKNKNPCLEILKDSFGINKISREIEDTYQNMFNNAQAIIERGTLLEKEITLESPKNPEPFISPKPVYTTREYKQIIDLFESNTPEIGPTIDNLKRFQLESPVRETSISPEPFYTTPEYELLIESLDRNTQQIGPTIENLEKLRSKQHKTPETLFKEQPKNLEPLVQEPDRTPELLIREQHRTPELLIREPDRIPELLIREPDRTPELLIREPDRTPEPIYMTPEYELLIESLDRNTPEIGPTINNLER